jgi:hypothetical protein
MKMKKIRTMVLIFLIVFLLGACSKNTVVTEKTEYSSTSEENGIVLNNKTIEGLKQGIIIGTPLTINEGFNMGDVEKVWGKPDQIDDHQDLQNYVYRINGQSIVVEDNIEEDGNSGYKFAFSVVLSITREDILKKMGYPTDLETKNILQYKYNGYKIQFDKFDKNTWNLHLNKSYPESEL